MYEQVSHSLLNDILTKLDPEIKHSQLRYFYTRLGANFYAIYSLFHYLYGERKDFDKKLQRLVETMARQFVVRPDELMKTDIERENNHNWFLSQKWAGMALYTDGFAGDLKQLRKKMSYFQELGINLIHIMPILKSPVGKSDGGYAISDYRQVDSRIGTMEDLEEVVGDLRKREILLVLDVVVNHTSNEHEWAKKARKGIKKYQDYYYIYENRDIPDIFEETMLQVFPETAPGNFTWDETMQKWVMTVFNNFQWDLNYTNPDVFIEMMDIILYISNKGADIVRLDAVAFLWKKLGSTSQNEREAHLILQLMKDCCQIVAPGVLFIAEAIVAPVEVTKYFGEDAINAKECEMAYNATYMALLWDAIATKSARLLNEGIKSLPDKLERATWLNYVRCHDDIGLGFDDADIRKVGYDPFRHRQFLVDYFTGQFADSNARGLPFGQNATTGDARISGSLASLVGLDYAIEHDNEDLIDESIERILLLHSLIMSFGGIPLLYYGDEIGTLNDCDYESDEDKKHDTRWAHRPHIDWEKAERRHVSGTVEYKIFNALKKMIAVRKEIPAFSDFNNRVLIHVDNPHLFVFSRFNLTRTSGSVLVVANFDSKPQELDVSSPEIKSFLSHGQIHDLYSGVTPAIVDDRLEVPPNSFYWLSD